MYGCRVQLTAVIIKWRVEMKSFVVSMVLVVSILTFVVGTASAGFGVRVLAGIDYIRYSDFNDYVSNLNENVLPSWNVSDEMGKIHFVPEIGGEVLFSVIPMINFGVGAGMIMGKSNLNISVGDGGLDYEHKIRVYPVTWTIYVKPSIPFLFVKPYAFAGGGIYFSKLSFTERVTSGSNEDGYTSDLTKSGYGVHGGVGVEFAVAPKVSINVEARGRIASIKGFTGTATSLDGEEMDVYLANYKDSYGNPIYGPESVDEVHPEGALDLSGYGFMVALKIFL